MSEPNKALSRFFGAYFHQDWDLDDPTWQAVVACFVKDLGEEAAKGVGQELDALLAQVKSDARLAQVLEELGCYYWAGSESETRAWLKSVSATLQAG